MGNEGKQFYDFGPFTVNVSRLALLRNGQHVPLGEKAFKTLVALLENRGRVVAKPELVALVWNTSHLDENNLKRQIHNVRKALGDDARAPATQYIRTISGDGYKFIGDVFERREDPSPAKQQQPFQSQIQEPLFPGDTPTGMATSVALPPEGGVLAASAIDSGLTSNEGADSSCAANRDSASVRPGIQNAALLARLFRRRAGQAAATPIRILVVFAVAVATGLVVLSLEFSHGSRAVTPLPLAVKVQRVFARATAEGGRPGELKLSRVPDQVVLTPDGARLYAIDYLSRSITVVDLLNLRVKGTLALPLPAHSAGITRDGKRMYVGASTDGVMIVDTERDRVLEQIFPTGGPVYSLAVTPDGEKLFLAMGAAGMKRILTRTGGSRSLSEVACPEYLAIDPDGRELFVSYQCGGPGGRSGHDALEIYDPNTEQSLATISGPPMVGGRPSFASGPPLILLEGGDACWIPSYDHVGCPIVPSYVYYVLRLTDRRIVQTLAMTRDGIRGVFVPGGKRIMFSGQSLTVVDAGTRTVLERFPQPGVYGRVAFTSTGSRAIVPVTMPPGLLVLDTQGPGCLPPEQGLFNLYSGDGTLDDGSDVGTLTARGALEFSPGVVGQAVRLKGDGLLHAKAQGACGDCSDAWSDSLFVKFAEFQGDMTVLERAATPRDPGHRLLKSEDDRITLELDGQSGAGISVSTAEAIHAGRWYHLAVNTDNGERLLYVNGVLIGRIPLPPMGPNPFKQGLGDVYVGATQHETDFLNGWVDEIAFYNRALRASEMRGIYELTLPGPCRP